MKFKPVFLLNMTLLMGIIFIANTTSAQQYKLRQSTSTMGMKSESTIYVKGMRKRTEGGGFTGITNLTIIEQCDLLRTIKINDKKKLYYIEPFSKQTEEIIDDDAKPVTKNKPVAVAAVESKDKTGGVITMWYNITDTGERKKMYGLTARHVWTTQKIKPSADACTMKDSMIIKTDGWYIDLPQFNCPVQYTPKNMSKPTGMNQPQCMDRFVSRRSGKGKLGFPLRETKTMIVGMGTTQTTQFESTLETLEFSTAKLDSMLFEIPLGYQRATSEEELQDKLDMNEMIKQAGHNNKGRGEATVNPDELKRSGVIRIGIYKPKGEEQLDVALLQEHLVNTLSGENVQAVAIRSEEDAKKINCDLVLTTDFIRVKQASKIGGLLKAIKNTDPSSVSSYNIEAELTLSNLSDGATRSKQKLNGKYDGKPVTAAAKALDDGCRKLLAELK